VVSDTQDGTRLRHAVNRELTLERLAVGAAILGLVAVLLATAPPARLFAWIPAIVAVAVATAVLGLGVRRRRFAALAIVFGWFAFSYSFALMLWG
jgi:hypothetical protein